MPERLPFHPSLLALNISGDLAGLTLYTTKNRKTVAYTAAPALKPPSPLQKMVRARFACSMNHWRLTDLADRRLYTAACNYLSLCMWGANLYSYLALTDPTDLWKTICSQTGYALVKPPDFTAAAMSLPTPQLAEVLNWIASHYGP